MSVPPLRLSNNFDPYISGEVIIHPSAVIAPGVILQAATNSKIIIGSGVCVGMGSILQVNEGTLEVEAGASLGAGFLMIGPGKIGTNACIGSATTVFNSLVAPGQVIPPGSIIGDTSRSIVETKQLETSTTNSASAKILDHGEEDYWAEGHSKTETKEGKTISSTKFSATAFLELQHESVPLSSSSDTPESESPAIESTPKLADSTETNPDSQPDQAIAESSNGIGTQIYGQGSIQRLLITLFPHRQSLSEPTSDEHSK
ncbi:hexapeptide repeat-containing transferase [Calothrix sp. PCC 7507]|uniref:hexapeptide repeat-containing transferase n=1 Tax=Calothrix sp. PCC 7507 TaxID=99598 RepID=UPI00029F1606|nr:hexapeptide repeat-containing transferase [Calothrix sp. PCC 7507]AFY31242.1 hexapeptide repeat-containing transferase [Calothrix sp. PCC 7507]